MTSTALRMTETLSAAATTTATATARNDIQSVASEMGEMIVIAARRFRIDSFRIDSIHVRHRNALC